MNKTDIDGVKTKVLTQHYWRLGGSKGHLAGRLTLTGPKQMHSIYPSLEKLQNPRGRIYNEKPNQQWLGAAVRLINLIKDWQKNLGPLAWPLTGDLRPFTQK